MSAAHDRDRLERNERPTPAPLAPLLQASAVLRAAALPLVIALLALTPFLDKAFTIDDPVFLLEARHALTDPLHPTAFSMVWNSELPERVSAVVPTGPVAAWIMMPAAAAGGVEWIAHAVQLLMLMLAALALVSAALHVGLAPRWATAAGVLLVTTPVTLGMAGTAMPDVPAMAFGIIGVERLLAWRQRGGWHRAVAGAVLLALAPLARSHLAALLVLGPLLVGADALLRPGRLRAVAALLWPFGLAAALAVVVLVVTRDPAPAAGGLASAAAGLSDDANAAFNTYCFAIHWVLATTFALTWVALRAGVLIRRWWLPVGASGAFALLRWSQFDPDAPYWIIPVAGLGLAALLDVLIDAIERRDGLQLVLGAWLFAPLPIAIYTHFPAKYLVAAAPAACLLVARQAQRRPGAGKWVVGTAAVAGLLLGAAILRADQVFAEVARTGVRRLVRPELLQGRTLWYDGHWGFHWYAEEAGARPWTATLSQPRPGDLILTNAVRSAPADEDAYRALVHLDRYEDRTPGGRVMSWAAGAGFFSNAWGYLPWSWGDDLIDAIDLWQAPGGPPPP